MRRLFILILIALLPLRSWAGDVMSIGMTLGAPAAAAAMAADCPAGMVMDASEEPAAEHEMPAPNCSMACDLCLPFSQVGETELTVTRSISDATPDFIETDFVSAPIALSFKPPIL